MHPQSTPHNSASQVEWRPVHGFPDYEVSADGRIRRLPMPGNWRGGRELRLHRNDLGYWTVGLYRDGRQVTCLVHRLVCRSFHGLPPHPQMHAAHENGNPGDNRADNLSWKTAAENLEDKRRHGTHGEGERHPMARIRDADVVGVFQLRAQGLTLQQIQAQTGLDYTHVSSILRRENWSHVEVAAELQAAAKAVDGRSQA